MLCLNQDGAQIRLRLFVFAGTRAREKGMVLTNAESDDAIDEELPFAKALERIVREGWSKFESSVVEFGVATPIHETKTTLRCHFLVSDPNGRQRLTALAEQLADQIIYYCIPRSAIAKAQALPLVEQIPEITRLARQAAELFTQTQLKTGEGAELLLYTLLESQLKIPQVLSKMSLKTSTEVQYQGADGVHAQVLENGDLAIYWGEAKLYESVADAMSDCLDSLGPYLNGSAQEQDVFLISHHSDTGNAAVTAELLKYFDNNFAQSANVETRGACLIGFTHENYPLLPRELENVREELEATVVAWRKGMKQRLKYRQLDQFVIEVFFVPVPDAQQLRDAIKTALRIPVITE